MIIKLSYFIFPLVHFSESFSDMTPLHMLLEEAMIDYKMGYERLQKVWVNFII